jgi:hypothetical protein
VDKLKKPPDMAYGKNQHPSICLLPKIIHFFVVDKKRINAADQENISFF